MSMITNADYAPLYLSSPVAKYGPPPRQAYLGLRSSHAFFFAYVDLDECFIKRVCFDLITTASTNKQKKRKKLATIGGYNSPHFNTLKTISDRL